MAPSVSLQKNNKILIFGRGGSGTSILAKAFRAGGVWFGDTRTLYHPDFDIHCEHSVLTRLGKRIIEGRKPSDLESCGDETYWKYWLKEVDECSDEEVPCIANKVLKGMLEIAQAGGHSCICVKTTVPFATFAGRQILSYFDECWGDYTIITSIRHPRWLYRREPSNLTEREFVSDWYKASVEAYSKSDHVVFFPESWENGWVRSLLARLGISWNKEIDSLFSPGRIKRPGVGVMELYMKDFPEVNFFYNQKKEK